MIRKPVVIAIASVRAGKLISVGVHMYIYSYICLWTKKI